MDRTKRKRTSNPRFQHGADDTSILAAIAGSDSVADSTAGSNSAADSTKRAKQGATCQHGRQRNARSVEEVVSVGTGGGGVGARSAAAVVSVSMGDDTRGANEGLYSHLVKSAFRRGGYLGVSRV